MSRIGSFAMPVMLIAFTIFVFCLAKEKLAAAKNHR